MFSFYVYLYVIWRQVGESLEYSLI